MHQTSQRVHPAGELSLTLSSFAQKYVIKKVILNLLLRVGIRVGLGCAEVPAGPAPHIPVLVEPTDNMQKMNYDACPLFIYVFISPQELTSNRIYLFP